MFNTPSTSSRLKQHIYNRIMALAKGMQSWYALVLAHSMPMIKLLSRWYTRRRLRARNEGEARETLTDLSSVQFWLLQIFFPWSAWKTVLINQTASLHGVVLSSSATCITWRSIYIIHSKLVIITYCFNLLAADPAQEAIVKTYFSIHLIRHRFSWSSTSSSLLNEQPIRDIPAFLC